MRSRRFILIASVAMAMGISCCIGVLYYLREQAAHVRQVTFVSRDWRAWNDQTAGLPTIRQRMLASVVSDGLPGANRGVIEQLLGPSLTREQMVRRPVPRRTNGIRPDVTSGEECYFDEYDWDLLYALGTENCLFYGRNGELFSPEQEFLIIRLDERSVYESWYVFGSEAWPRIVGPPANATYRPYRKSAQ